MSFLNSPFFPYLTAAFPTNIYTSRPDLNSLPFTTPLPPLAAILPPLIYYLALLLLPSFTNQSFRLIVPPIRSTLALLSCYLFFLLPLHHHLPFSIGLTYILALVGLYGGCRVLDVFFISPYLFQHIPRRVKYHHAPREESPHELHARRRSENSYFSLHFLQPKQKAVLETAVTDGEWPDSWADRASWALELELSMRGAGFTWSSADVRHTKTTWRPSVKDRTHSILLHVLPTLLLSWCTVRYIYTHHLLSSSIDPSTTFSHLPLPTQLLLTASLGAFLMSTFSLGHSTFAILLSPLSPHPLSYFPPLYTSRIWDLKSVRGFWSYGWHRLFSRLFLVYGVWPGEWIERKLTGKTANQAADVGKVLGGFVSSAVVHSFAAYTVVGGSLEDSLGELKFFAGCGVAVVVEEVVQRVVVRYRRQMKQKHAREEGADPGLEKWYDGVIGRIWWVSVLLFTGRWFARGWVGAGLVGEMAGF